MRFAGILIAGCLLAGCPPGIDLDPEGQYRCVPESSTARSQGGCPAGLFCGADQTCHAADAGGDYACQGDFGCGGAFRCGPLNRCVDPRADALRADAGDVVLSAVATLQPKAPWANVGAVGIGRTFLARSEQGQSVDVTPLAIAEGNDLYTVAVSTQGFTATERVYIGKATFIDTLVDAAPVRKEVFALSATRLYRYSWEPQFDGGIPILVTPPSDVRIGERLRVGNSAFPIVAEFNLDNREYRLHDSAKPNGNTGPNALIAPVAVGGSIEDIVDTDGRYIYASFNGVLYGAERKDALFAITNNGNDVPWTVVGLVSPGRDEQLVGCDGVSIGDKLAVRAIHVGDNPDLTQIERPLIALELDITRPDGGAVQTHWMRVDPDPQSPTCGAQQFPRHIARGLCPACGPGEALRDLQWGRAPGLQPALRSECTGADGGLAFYDLQTDSTGFACLRERRLGGGLPGAVTSRQRSNATVRAAAVDNRIYFRKDGLQPFVPLTLDHAPLAVERVDAGLIALGNSAVFRNTPQLGMAISSFVERTEPFPAAIASGSSWVIYDNGRVADFAQLGSSTLETLAAPIRADLKGPFGGTRADSNDGGSFVVVSSFDAILVANLSVPGTVAPLEVRVVPEAQVPILSVVALPPVSGPLVSGYVLTENRLFTLSAVSEARWETRPVAIPDGDWTRLFVDRESARIGYRDGAVVALPSGVAIAPPIASGAAVEDYAQYCGRSFALTSDALYRLDHTGGPIGTWSPVVLAELTGKRWRRLYGARTGELWVLADDGRAVALRGNPCVP